MPVHIKLVYLPKEPFWGFGDYLRGILSTAGICNKIGLTWDIDYHKHPISQFLVNNHTLVNIADYAQEEVKVYDVNQTDAFIEFMKSHEFSQQNDMRLLTTNVYWLENGVSSETRQKVIQSIQPTPQLQTAIDSTLKLLGVQEKRYRAVHVRMGDAYLVDKKGDPAKYEIVRAAIRKMIDDDTYKTEDPFVVFSDDEGIKQYLHETEGFLQSPSVPCHLSSEEDGTKVMNTLVDFFLLSKADTIYRYSFHVYGSGFCDWCADIFEVPIFTEEYRGSDSGWQIQTVYEFIEPTCDHP
jgi:hypothetical protein